MASPNNIAFPNNELAGAVGHLFLAAARCESALTLLLGGLASYPDKINHRVAFSYSEMGLKVKLATISDFVLFMDENWHPDVQKILNSIRRQFDHRNVIAHNFARLENDKILIRPLKTSSKKIKAPKAFGVDDIIRIGNVITCRTDQLQNTMYEYGVSQNIE